MDTAPRPVRAVQGVLVGGAAVAIVLVLLDAAVTRVPWAPQWRDADSMVRIYFDVAREQNLPTWVNVCLLALAGAIAGVVAALAGAARDRSAIPWAVFALTCLALSLDDMTALHERLDAVGRGLGGGSGLTYAAWVIPGLVVAVLVVLAVVVLVRRTSRPTRRLLVAGLSCLLVGAFGLESLGNAVLESEGFGRSYAWFVAAEELLETLGAVLLLAGALSGVRIEPTGDGVHVRFRTMQRVRPPGSRGRWPAGRISGPSSH